MTLARYDLTATDEQGNVLSGASVEVRAEQPGAPLASLYSDRAGTTPIANPTTTDSHGDAGFFILGGFYKIEVTSGLLTKTRRYVGVGLAQGSDIEPDGITQRYHTAAGTVTVGIDDADIIVVKKTVGAPTRVVMPSSASVTKSRRIADGKFDALTNNMTIVPERPHTVTISIASPGVVTLAAHGLSANAPVSFETTGALPTGITADTQLYVKTVLGSSTFTVSATPGGAAINTSGSQSGVHTMGKETILGLASYLIDSNGGSVVLTPFADGSGYF